MNETEILSPVRVAGDYKAGCMPRRGAHPSVTIKPEWNEGLRPSQLPKFGKSSHAAGVARRFSFSWLARKLSCSRGYTRHTRPLFVRSLWLISHDSIMQNHRYLFSNPSQARRAHAGKRERSLLRFDAAPRRRSLSADEHITDRIGIAGKDERIDERFIALIDEERGVGIEHDEIRALSCRKTRGRTPRRTRASRDGGLV